MTTAIFNELIKKTSDYDKDERYMATSDIINHLSKDIKIDEILEKKICVAILKQLGTHLLKSFLLHYPCFRIMLVLMIILTTYCR